MAYTPTLADIEEIGSGGKYTPSLADIDEMQAPKRTASKSLLDKLVNNSITDTVIGAGDQLNNAFRNLHNLMTPQGMNVPLLQGNRFSEIDPTAYKGGQFLGDMSAFMGGGAGLNALRESVQGAPIIGQAAQALGGNGLSGLTRRAAGAGIYGGVMNPEDRAQGTNLGAGLSVALDMIPGIGKGIAAASQAIRPQKYADELLAQLGGKQTLGENAKSLTKDLRNAYQSRRDESTEMYNKVFEPTKGTSIYTGNQIPTREPVENFKSMDDVLGFMKDKTGREFENAADLRDFMAHQYGNVFSTNKEMLNFFNSFPSMKNMGKYADLESEIMLGFSPKTTKLHQSFAENPNLQNAHELQSQLGSEIRALEKKDRRGNLSPFDQQKLQNYRTARGAVQEDMNNFLDKVSPGLNTDYQKATKNYAQNVAPYLNKPKIANIVKDQFGNEVLPANLSTIFKNPNANMSKIVSDMGPGAANKILFSELGKRVPSSSADALNRGIKNLEQQGLESYINPSLAKKFETLENRIGGRNIAQRLSGGLLGYGALHPIFGHVPIDMLGALGAAVASPAAMRKLGEKLPLEKVGKSLLDTLKDVYSVGRPATLAGALSGSNQ